tara:strand:- start:761 stop:1159 length:399 start_codon:yes stop_codon:yes gene_type:complete
MSASGITLAGVVILIGYAAINRTVIKQYVEENVPESWINILGYTGGFMQLGAVLAVSRGLLDRKSVSYHTLSLVGSSGLLLNAFYYGANPAVVINTIWMSMNVIGIVEGVSNLEVLDDLPSLDVGYPASTPA